MHTETIDLTPEALKTPEGAKRCNAAMEAQQAAIVRVANAAGSLERVARSFDTMKELFQSDEWKDLIETIEERREADDELVSSLIGRPKRKRGQ